MKKIIYFLMALMLVVMPSTVNAATASGEEVDLSKLTLKADVTNNGEIKLTLSGATADSYTIYRQNSNDGSNYKQVAEIKTTTYTDKGLKTDGLYYYYVTAKKSNTEKNVYINNGITPIKTLAAPKFSIKKSKVGYTSLEFNIKAVAGATSYEIYEVDASGKYNLITTASSYNLNATAYNTSYGKHTYAVRAKLYNGLKDVYSGYTKVNYTYAPEAPVLKINAINYDKNEIVIAAPKTYSGSSVNYSDNIKVDIYRSIDNKEWTKIKTVKVSSYAGTTYTDTIKDAKLGKKYYYRAVLNYEGTKSGNGKAVNIKSALTKPTFEIYNSYNDKQTIEVTNTGKNVKYEIYQATKKDGKYTKVCTTKNGKCDVKATMNKKYFYKVRAILGSTKSKYSEIKNLKLEMKSLIEEKELLLASTYNRYTGKTSLTKYYGGYVYYNNYAEAKIKKVTLTKKSGGNMSKFEVKIDYKEKKTDAKKTMPVYLTVYNYDQSKAYVVTLNEKFSKGTKKNTTSKYTVKIPKWATYFEIN